MTGSYIRNGEIHLRESPDIRWFEKTNNECRCGKAATGILRGSRNESFGPHCERCAAKRIKDSAKARAFIAKRIKDSAKARAFIAKTEERT